MSNFAVNKAGRDLAIDTLNKKGFHAEHRKPTGPDKRMAKLAPWYRYNCQILKDDVVMPLVIWTKTAHEKRINNKTHLVTGKSQFDLDILLKLKQEVGDVFICFVDAQIGAVKGDWLSNLMTTKMFEDQMFPLRETTHFGKVVYFNFYLIPTIDRIDEDDLDELRKVIQENRSPKGQTMLGI